MTGYRSLREARDAILRGEPVVLVDYGPRPEHARDDEWATWCDHKGRDAERGYLAMTWPVPCACEPCRRVRALQRGMPTPHT